jgi:hypothetical protein
MVNIQDHIDGAQCYQAIRDTRRPDGLACPRFSSGPVTEGDRDQTRPRPHRWERWRRDHLIDDLTSTTFASHHQVPQTWIACLDLTGSHLSGLQSAQEYDINKDDAWAMIETLRIHSRQVGWGHGRETVCHAAGEYARDDDGNGFLEVQVDTFEGCRVRGSAPVQGSPRGACPYSQGSCSSFTSSERIPL